MQGGSIIGGSWVDDRRMSRSLKRALKLGLTDLAARLRNQVAITIRDMGDSVVEDDPAIIADADRAHRLRSNEEGDWGWVLLTHQRLFWARGKDQQATSSDLADVQLVHVEEGWVTISHSDGRNVYALTLGFTKKSKMPSLIADRLRT